MTRSTSYQVTVILLMHFQHIVMSNNNDNVWLPPPPPGSVFSRFLYFFKFFLLCSTLFLLVDGLPNDQLLNVHSRFLDRLLPKPDLCSNPFPVEYQMCALCTMIAQKQKTLSWSFLTKKVCYYVFSSL